MFEELRKVNPHKEAVQDIDMIIKELKDLKREYDIPEVHKILEKLLLGQIEPIPALEQATKILKNPPPEAEHIM